MRSRLVCFCALLSVFLFADLVVSEADVMPIPGDCTKYQLCDYSGCFVFNCGIGTEYNPRVKVCDYPLRDRSYCGNRDIRTPQNTYYQEIPREGGTAPYPGYFNPGATYPGSQGGAIPGGAYPGGQAPGGAYPGGQAPGITYLGGQATGGAYPGGQVPGAATYPANNVC